MAQEALVEVRERLSCSAQLSYLGVIVSTGNSCIFMSGTSGMHSDGQTPQT